VFYLVGIGGLIGGIAGPGGPFALTLLIFPAFARLFVIPLIRHRQRDDAETFFTERTVRAEDSS
jgi:hypothetical protein